jgi:predicted chitinase
MILRELFTPGKDYKWSFTGSEEAVAVFHIGEVPYQFYAFSYPEDNGVWEVEFKNAERGRGRTAKFGLTGTGNSAEVMSTVTDIMRDFLQRYQDKITGLTFTADEQSRQSLYARMAKRLLPTWTLSQTDKQFVLSAPSQVDEGWKDWVAGAAIAGAATLGAGAEAKTKPNIPTSKAQLSTQYKQAPKADPGMSILSNNTEAESVLHKTARAAGIKGTELAQFMAQTKHESADFSRMKEIGGKEYFAKRYDPRAAPKTAKILGNTQAGDGVRYHGRGYIQITGRDNYRMAGEALGLPLEQHPEMASKPAIAAKIAVWYWKTRVKPFVQNFNDTEAVTRKINPAMRGLKDRYANFVDYKRIL